MSPDKAEKKEKVRMSDGGITMGGNHWSNTRVWGSL